MITRSTSSSLYGDSETACRVVDSWLRGTVKTSVRPGGYAWEIGVFADPAIHMDNVGERDDHQMYAVPMDTGSSRSAGNPELLFEGRFEIAPGGNLNYDVAPDGRFLMLRNSQGSEAARFNVVLNWFKILEQRVPAF